MSYSKSSKRKREGRTQNPARESERELLKIQQERRKMAMAMRGRVEKRTMRRRSRRRGGMRGEGSWCGGGVRRSGECEKRSTKMEERRERGVRRRELIDGMCGGVMMMVAVRGGDEESWAARASEMEEESGGDVNAGVEFDVRDAVMKQLAVLASVSLVGGYWWLVLVPSERRSLAKSKRRGEVNEYLNELEEATSTSQQSGNQMRALERWFYTDWLEQRRGLKKRRESRSTATTRADMSTAGNMETGSESEEEKKVRDIEARSSLDGEAQPAFLSLDNPIVLTAVLTAVGVLLAILSR